MEYKVNKESIVRRLVSNNWIIAIVVAIVSSLPVVYFHYDGIHERNLTYFIHPVKSVIVQSGQSSDIQVSFRGKAIKGDITSLQIAFWNEGKESIRTQHVLHPFIIETHEHSPILEAKIRKQSREVVGLKLDKSEMEQGQLGISWFILEESDGGVVQLILAGDADTDISVYAVIEGQKQINFVSFDKKINSPHESYSSIFQKVRVGGWVALTYGLFFLVAMLIALYSRKRKNPFYILDRLDYWSLAISIFSLCFGLFAITMAKPPGPPFGFF